MVIFSDKSVPFSVWRLLCCRKKFVTQSRCSLLKSFSIGKAFFHRNSFNRKFAVSCSTRQAMLLPLPLQRVVSYRTCTSADPYHCCGFISTFPYFEMFSCLLFLCKTSSQRGRMINWKLQRKLQNQLHSKNCLMQKLNK